MNLQEIRGILGRVNATEFGGKPAGTLLVKSMEFGAIWLDGETKNHRVTIAIEYNRNGWNNLFNGERYLPIVDADGKPMFSAIEFPFPSEQVIYSMVEMEYAPLNVPKLVCPVVRFRSNLDGKEWRFITVPDEFLAIDVPEVRAE